MRLPDDDLEPTFQINIVPMIDVIFAILTFFIMSSLFLTKSTGLPVTLPQAATAEPQAQSRITVTIDRQGQIALNRQPAQLEDLPARIRTLMTNNQPTLVVVSADTSVDYGRVVATMDRLRTIPGVKLAIAAQKL
ncbi:ExbD/TolR family protein [Pantanalinema rosaneae CENA516]|uniref:ExbD/TolR family protein n=1 Tax=Pantanalinema rosaneae TaxID=1620701 RepID=UPI003D6E329A